MPTVMRKISYVGSRDRLRPLYVNSGPSTRRGQILRASLSLLGDKSLAAILAVDVTLQVMRPELHTASSRNNGS